MRKAFSAVKDDRDPPGQRSWGRGSQYPAKFPDSQDVVALQAIAWGVRAGPRVPLPQDPGCQELGLPWEDYLPCAPGPPHAPTAPMRLAAQRLSHPHPITKD